MNLKKDYDISIIMAVYNMEQYLDDAIRSIMIQTTGIEKIQIILVNDGSVDSSLKICKEYEKKYPQNVVVIDKENGGVSSARNAGLEIASGKYINFMDSDDMLKEDVCERVLKFFSDNDVDVVSIPLKYFGAKDDEHMLNWKFSKTRVIDLDEEPEATQMHISSSFLRKEVVKEFRFQLKLKYGEDAEVINKCILQKRRYGVIAETAYLYRYRESDDSAMQKSKNSYDNYFPVLKYLYWSLIRYEKKLTGKEKISKYLENLILYDLKWKLKRKEVNEKIVFGTKGKKQFLEEVSEILQEIDDTSIICLKNYSIIYKMFMYSIKYGLSIDEMEEQYKIVSGKERQYIVWKDFILSRVEAVKLFIEILNIDNGNLKMEGKIGGSLRRSEVKIYMVVEDGEKKKIYPVKKKEEWRSDTFALNENIKKRFYFKTPEVEVHSGMKISFLLDLEGRETKLQIGFARLAKVGDKYKNSYALENDFIVSKEKNYIQIEEYNSDIVSQKEIAYLEEIEKEEKLSKEDFLLIKDIRKEYLEKLEKEKKKRIWIFMDRPGNADDNAEHLFRYAVKQQDGIEKYYVVSRDSRDYVRMKQYGKVVDYGSREHMILMLQAEAIISSHVNNHTYSPFSETLTPFFTGFLTAKRVFLQHGITKDDVSNWLHKLNKNLSVFVTASPYEYQSIVEGKYGYDNGEVVLTGFPRYDNLKDASEKYILFMPTWDSTVSKMKNDFPVYNPEFKNSKLFEEVDGFLNNVELNKFLKESGYKILFKPHPNMMIQMNDFKFGENVILADESKSYQDLFAMGAALVTDYSSTFFDFAYLKKPVIYYQARSNHYVDGYFNYEDMGMGKVVRSEQELVDKLREYIHTGFQLEKKYLERTKAFFGYLDHSNCERVYHVMREKFS